MDRLIYTAMTGAKHALEQQATTSHNLANATTTGFRAQIDQFRAVPVQGAALATRAFVVDSTTGSDFRAGVIQQTGRDLDVAVQGDGWIAVQAADGSEAYTRAGNLQLTADGLLTDSRGNLVLGDGGPISLPPSGQVGIGSDGTISVVPSGQAPSTVTSVGKLKLVNPPANQLALGSDGLMHLAGGGVAQADPAVSVKSGVLESSNVNPSETLVQMIELSRQYELQVKAIKNADDNAQSATRLLQLS